jgi:hypothetical protein
MTAEPATIPAIPLIPAGVVPPPAPQPAEAPKTVPAMPLLIGGVPKPPTEGFSADTEIVLTFPDEAVGTLVLSKHGEGADIRTAVGEVRVPSGWTVQLNLPESVRDGAALAALPGDGVHVLIAPGLDDEALDAIAHYRVLTYLRLGDAITDAGVARLSGLGTLTMLSISSEQVSDAAMESLLPLTELLSVHLAPSALTDAGLATLARLAKVSSMSVTAPKITDAGAGALAGCGTLTDLTLNSPELGNAAVTALAASTSLRSMSLTGAFDNAGLLELTHGFPELQSARIDGEGVTTAGVMAAFAAGISAQLNGQWFSPKAVERLRRNATS